MKFVIKHEIKGRIRIQAIQSRMTCIQADTLQYYLSSQRNVTSVKVQERSQSAVIYYDGKRENILEALAQFNYMEARVPEDYLRNSGRELNRTYWEKLVSHVLKRCVKRLFFPYQLRVILTLVKSVRYLKLGIASLIKGKIEVPVLDATAIGVSMLRGDFKTAGSIMFLLGIGEILEEWTHKKSVDDLARSMSLNIGNVWLCDGDDETLVSASDIKIDDFVKVYMGNVIPFDGTVVSGEAMINQASLTGESMAVRRISGASVYAGTIVEEGELTVQVKEVSGGSKFEKIVTMIEETEKLKSSLEGKAEHLADKLVPYTLAGTALVWLLTKNMTKALSVLMVDFSCALKLAMPISVLSAMREAGNYKITVKGGKYLEAMAEADTIIFDKTGTLTKAEPVVKDVLSFNGQAPDELLRIAACLEEHFPHSMAKAVVDAAREKGLKHEGLHSEVEYIVAHGISSTVNGKRAVIGSHHFIFDDEKCEVKNEFRRQFEDLPSEYSHLYMAIEGELAAVICVQDPLRPEAAEVIKELKQLGIKRVVMMTGDSERTARAIAEMAGVDEYHSEVLPEDKADFVEKEKKKGKQKRLVKITMLEICKIFIILSTSNRIYKRIGSIYLYINPYIKRQTI